MSEKESKYTERVDNLLNGMPKSLVILSFVTEILAIAILVGVIVLLNL